MIPMVQPARRTPTTTEHWHQPKGAATGAHRAHTRTYETQDIGVCYRVQPVRRNAGRMAT